MRSLRITTESKTGDRLTVGPSNDERGCTVQVFIEGVPVWKHWEVIVLHRDDDPYEKAEQNAVEGMLRRLGEVLDG